MTAGAADADPPPKRLHVVVALCDNAHQGIVKVNARIGNGDDLENNLYWGCSEGLWKVFDASKDWALVESKKASPNPDADDPWEGVKILETRTWRHTGTGAILVAEAWRGREIRGAMERFVALLAENDAETTPDLVAWIGHNGLMDFKIAYDPSLKAAKARDAVVLCCVSHAYFGELLADRNVRPVLTTEQLMYPGAFLLKAALDGWLRGESRPEIRERAAKAYAANQGIGVKAARGVFTALP